MSCNKNKNAFENMAPLFDFKMTIAQSHERMKKAYICSPCLARSIDGIYDNMMAARYYMYYAYTTFGVRPRAPHAVLPVVLNDGTQSERDMALDFGQKLLHTADEMLVCGHILSEGMRSEILTAIELNIPITVYSLDLFREIKKLTDSTLIRLDKNHRPLTLNGNELIKF